MYSNQRVLSYVAEVNNIEEYKSMSANILIEKNNGEITSVSNIANTRLLY